MSTRDLSRYNNAQIYSIRSHMTSDVYYGYSCKMLSKRIHDHRIKFKKYKDGIYKKYISSYEVLKYPDHYIELEAKVPCTSIEELRAVRNQYVRNNLCVNIITLDERERRQQYYQQNKERIKQYRKQRYQENPERERAYYRQYYQDNKEKELARKKEYRQNNKEKEQARGKQYRENNKEKEIARCKQYYENNKQSINQKMTCECGSVIAKRGYKKHLTTKKHKKWLGNN